MGIYYRRVGRGQLIEIFGGNVLPKYAIITGQNLRDGLFRQLDGVYNFGIRDFEAIDIRLHSGDKELSICFGRYLRRRLRI